VVVIKSLKEKAKTKRKSSRRRQKVRCKEQRLEGGLERKTSLLA